MIPDEEQQSTKMCPPKKPLPFVMPAKPKKMTRSKSDGAAYSISRASRTAAAASSTPSSPESVVTYLGRSYSFKDLFPDLDVSSLGDLNSDSEDESDKSDTDNEQFLQEQQQPREEVPIKHIVAPARVLRPTAVEATTGQKKSPRRPRRMMRTKSAGPRGGLGRNNLPARSKSSEDLSEMVAAVQHQQKEKEEAAAKPPPGLLRSTTLNAVKSIFGDHSDADIHDEDKRFGMYSNSVRTLNFTQVDVANICDDHQEFERLKATVKKQGAVTNEVLKQGLHFYVQAKKDRDANPGSRGTSRSGHRRRRCIPARRTRSDDQELSESATARTTDRPAAMKRSGTTGIIL